MPIFLYLEFLHWNPNCFFTSKFKRTKPNFVINRSNRLFESDPYVWFWTMIYHFYYFLYYDISKTLNRTRQKDRNFTSVLELYIQYYYKLCFYFKLNVKLYSTKTNFYSMCCFSSRGRRLFHTDKGSSLVISLDIFCLLFIPHPLMHRKFLSHVCVYGLNFWARDVFIGCGNSGSMNQRGCVM